MFDKLIESNSEEAEFKPRRKFFMVSSVVVGILFLSAVVFSLYAQDINLGTDNFELAEILAPVAADAPQPEPPRQQQQTNPQRDQTELPNRPVLIAQIDQAQRVPETISTSPNKYASIPEGTFTNDVGKAESDGRGGGPTIGTGNIGSGSSSDEPVAEVVKTSEPPPVAAAPAKKPVTQSKGVINGIAVVLPKPIYPAVARSINLTGTVSVQVLIDESGQVVSAKAMDGHPFFKLEAERAARIAKFKPTLLSEVPVKVTGIIVYKFTR